LDKRKELLKKAYRLGYFVGFYGHTEWAAWISEEKEEIYLEAQLLGIYEKVKKVYAFGKEEGAKKREELIQKGLSIEPPKSKEEIKKKVMEEPKGLIPMEEVKKTGKHYLSFLESDKIVARPKLFKKVKIIKKPNFLKLPSFIRE